VVVVAAAVIVIVVIVAEEKYLAGKRKNCDFSGMDGFTFTILLKCLTMLCGLQLYSPLNKNKY
jgi:hypothetical protein